MESKDKGGRRPGLIEYREVFYNGKEYIVGTLQKNGEDIEFIFDKEDYDKVEPRPWHFASDNYISTGLILDGKRKELYLHNLIMNRLEFRGKGQRETVDHINRNGRDNRKENLRILSQTDQNIHQVKKKRSITLPPNCGINPDDIPRHIWYVKPNGNHGPRFAIEFKSESLVWKGTSSKTVSLQEKLYIAKQKLEEFYTQYPHLNPRKEDERIQDLSTTFNEILDAPSTKN